MKHSYFDAGGRQLSEAEALLPSGAVRAGVRLSVPMSIIDSRPGPHVILDSAERAAVVAKARRQHELSQGYRGADARPFTDAMAQAAVAARTAEKAAGGGLVMDSGELARLKSSQAGTRAAVDHMRCNAWRQPINS